MTINICLASAEGIYLGADFRISDLLHHRYSDNSSKIVSVAYFDWNAAIIYSGVGRFGRKFTFEYMTDWLTHAPDLEQSFDEVKFTICEAATRWIKSVHAVTNRIYQHSFLMAGFSRGGVDVAIISNFEQFGAPHTSAPRLEFQISQRRVNSKFCWIGGMRPAVTRADYRYLLSFNFDKEDPNVIQHAIARVIERSSRTREAKLTISPGSYVYTMFPGNQASGIMFDRGTTPIRPVTIFNGQDMDVMLRRTGLISSNTRVLSSALFSFSRDQPYVDRPCLLESPTLQTIGDNFRHQIYPLEQGGATTGDVCGMSADATLYGTLNTQRGGPVRACSWKDLGGAEFLTPIQRNSHLNSVNADGHGVGSFTSSEGKNRACLWAGCGLAYDLGTLGGLSSSAKAINSLGLIVGSSWTNPGSPNDPREKAFHCCLRLGMREIPLPRADWSRGVDVNENSVVLCKLGVGQRVSSYVWDEVSGHLDIGTLGGSRTTAVALNDNGEVVGVSEDRKGALVPFIWSGRAGIRPLHISLEGNPVDINNDGDVLLNQQTDFGVRSAIWGRDGRLTKLPWFKYHSTQASCFLRDGWIGGKCYQSNGHSHPIIWRPTKDDVQ